MLRPGTLIRRIGHLLRSREDERDMDEEMRQHLELEVADRVRRGISPDEARRGALVDFGGVERYKEEGRSARGIRPLQDVVRDVAYAARSLSKSPGLTLMSVLTVALGMTATTIVFSIVNAVLFRPPMVADPHRLFVVAEVWENGERSTSTSMAQPMYPYAHYLAVREATTAVFAAMAGYRHGSVAMRVGDEARPTSSIASTPNYFAVLGLRPALGRFFSDTSEHAAVEPEAVISHDLWMNRFVGDSSVIGGAIFLDGRPMAVVGVAPRGDDADGGDRWWPRGLGGGTAEGRSPCLAGSRQT
jgi:hypothetical protein